MIAPKYYTYIYIYIYIQQSSRINSICKTNSGILSPQPAMTKWGCDQHCKSWGWRFLELVLHFELVWGNPSIATHAMLRIVVCMLLIFICALARGYRPGGANCGTIVAPLCLQKLVTSLIQISLLSLLESVSRVGPQGIRDVIQHHAASLVHCFIAFKDFSSDVFPGGFRLSPQSCLERTWFQNLALWFMFGLIDLFLPKTNLISESTFGDLFL